MLFLDFPRVSTGIIPGIQTRIFSKILSENLLKIFALFLLKFNAIFLSEFLPGLLSEVFFQKCCSKSFPSEFYRIYPEFLLLFLFQGFLFGGSAGALANVSHRVLPVIHFRGFPGFPSSCSDPPDFLFTDFPGITARVLFGILTGNCNGIVVVRFGISLTVALT